MARRKILITGGTSGIGLALVKKLVFKHDVMVVGRMLPENAAAVLPSTCLYCQADLTDADAAVEAVASALLKANWATLDNAVLNAGCGKIAKRGTETAENIRETLDVNLVSSMFLAHALYPWLVKAGGTLTIVGSVTHKGHKLFPAYAASKGGLNGLARSLRSEWRGKVAVQIVHPGPTNTAMHDKAGLKLNWVRDFFLKPNDVAAMMVFAMARKRSPVKLSFFKYINGGSVMGRPL